jgi:DNA-binding HxlR family transcriptional regulator/peroxiredoxin
VTKSIPERDAVCAIAQAAAVIGDWWSILIVREVARGRLRFDELVGELTISRKVLAERLAELVASEVLERVPYQHRPTRHEYRLTASGRALLTVLVAMQDWADRWLLGDGSLTGLAEQDGAGTARVLALTGTRLPPLTLPAHTGGEVDVIDSTSPVTVVFCYPATGFPGPLPDGWSTLPGAAGCTLENRLFRDAYQEFQAARVAVRGVSTQRPDEQRAFAAAEQIPFPLLSDMDLRLAATLRLPTFHAGQGLRLKRAIIIADSGRVLRQLTFPVTDIPAAVTATLSASRQLAATAAGAGAAAAAAAVAGAAGAASNPIAGTGGDQPG